MKNYKSLVPKPRSFAKGMIAMKLSVNTQVAEAPEYEKKRAIGINIQVTLNLDDRTSALKDEMWVGFPWDTCPEVWPKSGAFSLFMVVKRSIFEN